MQILPLRSSSHPSKPLRIRTMEIIRNRATTREGNEDIRPSRDMVRFEKMEDVGSELRL